MNSLSKTKFVLYLAAIFLAGGVTGATVAVVVGALSNDSGPIILLIGTSYLALGVGYFWAAAIG